MQNNAKSVRVMTWNLWWKFGPWKERFDAITRTIQEVGPDVVLLQEVWNDTTDGNQAERLAQDLGFNWTYAAAASIDSTELGNAILSRWPINKPNSVALPASHSTPEGRCAVYCMIDSPHGPLFVTTAHLTWQRNNSIGRQAQVRALVDVVKANTVGTWPPILGGDFNADADSDEIRMLTGRSGLSDDALVFQDAWEHGGDGTNGHTWTPESQYYSESRKRDVVAMPWLRRRLDYIFIGLPDGRPAETKAIQVEKTWLVGNDGSSEGSDHFAVVADLSPHRID